jgi:hypothetical protein
LTGRIPAETSGKHLAYDGFVDLRWFQAGSLQGTADRDGTQLGNRIFAIEPLNLPTDVRAADTITVSIIISSQEFNAAHLQADECDCRRKP